MIYFENHLNYVFYVIKHLLEFHDLEHLLKLRVFIFFLSLIVLKILYSNIFSRYKATPRVTETVVYSPRLTKRFSPSLEVHRSLNFLAVWSK